MRSMLLLGAGLAVLIAAPAAQAADPPLTVSPAKLSASLTCQRAVTKARSTPVLLVTGTGVPGKAAWAGAFQKALLKSGHASCFITFPANTTGDVQNAAEYVVSGVRTMAKRAQRPIAIYGISQGGLLPRLALTFWPGARKLVTDVVALAGTQHGTTVSLGDCSKGCAPSIFQQAPASNVLKALNAHGSESPGPTSWTTVRSLADAIVQPVGGPAPTSALKGATNLVVQNVCPGRQTDHIGMAYDSVSYAVLLDAITHKGTAKASRLSKGVCAAPYVPGLDVATTKAEIAAAYGVALASLQAGPLVAAEPALRAPFSG